MPQYNADRRTIGELLSLTASAKRLFVPDWQRNYSWETEEVQTFWTDLTGFAEAHSDLDLRDHEYFLGSIVIVQKDDGYELLDGQQRLATATILLSVIREHLDQYKADAATRLEQRFIFDEDDAAGERVYKLTLGRYDADFFRREVQDRYVGDGLPTPTLLSHKLIRKARQYFVREFRAKYSAMNGGEAAYKWALRIQRILTDHLSVVEITSIDEDGAAEVFETLNKRGMELSTTDLLRNLLLRRSGDNDRTEINESWGNIFQLEERVEEFLRHWWLSTYGDLTGRSLFKAFKPRVTSDELTPIDLTRRLDTAASIYQTLLECRDSDREVAGMLQDIKDLGAKLLYPVLLSTYSASPYEAQKKRMLTSLIALFVRYNVVGRLEGTRLEPELYDIAKQLRVDDSVAYVDRMRNFLFLNFTHTNERFAMEFQTVDVPRQATARYLLRKIENSRRDAHGTSELEIIRSTERVHLEHIYPQTPSTGKWENHDNVIHRLGNLTLLSARLNRTVRNAPFAEKKPKYLESELLITRELDAYEFWNIDAITQRQSRFAEAAPSIWAFPE